ncbi:MAG: hypothetical protein JST92_05515 [Deltaproteobacteria bacterium]|nr:hypothetical protein [Deltaproteobacteria bacterium]
MTLATLLRTLAVLALAASTARAAEPSPDAPQKPADASKPLILEENPPPPPAPTAAQASGAAPAAADSKPAQTPARSTAGTPDDQVKPAANRRDSFADDEGPPPGPPPPTRPRRRRQPPPMPAGEARTGLILGLGAGGGMQYSSEPGLGHTGASNFDLRIGYGVSDRFQFFFDADTSHARYAYGEATDNSTFTLRGQTVLFGDRKGNGISLNGGVGLGSYSNSYSDYITPVYASAGGQRAEVVCCDNGGFGGYRHSELSFVGAAGLSFDARVGRYLTLSPELYFSWHALPNNENRPIDIVTEAGIRFNLVWYLR